jgi:hypothetical protein
MEKTYNDEILQRMGGEGAMTNRVKRKGLKRYAHVIRIGRSETAMKWTPSGNL